MNSDPKNKQESIKESIEKNPELSKPEEENKTGNNSV